MKTEELLEDRWKVIGNYLSSPYQVGDIVQISGTGTTFLGTITDVWDEFKADVVKQENYFNITTIGNFPALFRKLFWWEDRAIEDMPGYVKPKKCPDVVFKIIEAKKSVCLYQNSAGGTNIENFSAFLPATKEEYLTYINKQ